MHLKQWDTTKMELEHDWGKVSKGRAISLAISPDDKFVYVGSDDKKITKWSFETKEKVFEFT